MNGYPQLFADYSTLSKYWFRMLRMFSIRPDFSSILLFFSAYSSSVLKFALPATISAPMPVLKVHSALQGCCR